MGDTPTSKTKEMLGRILNGERLKYCFECGICTASCSMAELVGKGYSPRSLLGKTVLDPESVLDSSALWLCAWCYNCSKHCPQALRLPEIFHLMRTVAVEKGGTSHFDKALREIVESVPLPLVTMAVCFHPERAGLNLKDAMEKTEHVYRERLEKERKKKVLASSEGKVAVIGSGPAGLTVAQELAKKGRAVTVFESLPEPGGMLRKCIPEYRLPREVLAKEIQILRDSGVRFKNGVTVGKDLSFADLWKKGYLAVFVGLGAHRSQRLKIKGAETEGVVHALDFLWSVNRGEKVEVGKDVTVIGGGNVAVDSSRTALHQGAQKVAMLYRRSRDEMPANPWEVKEAEAEGVKIEFLVAPKKILSNGGRVSGLECVRMQLGEPDESGRKKPIPVEGSEFTKPTNMVILAVGEIPELGSVPKEMERNEDNTIWIDPVTMETSLQGVFAGGDAVTGPASIIEAIRAGKCAAESIESYLRSLEK